MANKLIVSLSPHVHGGDSVQKTCMRIDCADTVPCLYLSTCLVWGCDGDTDFCHCVLVLQMGYHQIHIEAQTYYHHGRLCPDRYSLLAFSLPSNLPCGIIIIGALVAIGIGVR